MTFQVNIIKKTLNKQLSCKLMKIELKLLESVIKKEKTKKVTKSDILIRTKRLLNFVSKNKHGTLLRDINQTIVSSLILLLMRMIKKLKSQN